MSLFDRLKTAKQRVIILLQQHPRLRDSDNKLISNYWYNEMGDRNIGATEFLRQFSIGKFTSPETIRRVRQKIQEQNPNLRGKYYKSRHNEAEILTTQIHEL